MQSDRSTQQISPDDNYKLMNHISTFSSRHRRRAIPLRSPVCQGKILVIFYMNT